MPKTVALDKLYWREQYQRRSVDLTGKLRAREGVTVLSGEELRASSRLPLP